MLSHAARRAAREERELHGAAASQCLRDARGDAARAARQHDHLGAAKLLLVRREGFRLELDDAPALTVAEHLGRAVRASELRQRHRRGLVGFEVRIEIEGDTVRDVRADIRRYRMGLEEAR